MSFEKINELNDDFISLYDVRDAELNINFFDVISIAKLAKKVTAGFCSVRTAILVNQPDQTAYSLLFTKESTHKKTVRKVFSTEEAAIEWLNLSLVN